MMRYLQPGLRVKYLYPTSLAQNRTYSKSFAEKYLSTDFPPIGAASQILETVHDTTGLPWWATIALTTVGLRSVITLPLAIYGQRIMAKLEAQQPELKEKASILLKEVAHAKKHRGWTQKEAEVQFKMNFKRIIKEMYIRDNNHPMKSGLVMLFQIPLWLSMSFALRNLTGSLQFGTTKSPPLRLDMANEGTLWFENLILPDSTWLLSLCLGTTQLALLKLFPIKGDGKLVKTIRYSLGFFAVIIVPVSAQLPAAMTFYWLISSLFGFSQNIILRQPTIKKLITSNINRNVNSQS